MRHACMLPLDLTGLDKWDRQRLFLKRLECLLMPLDGRWDRPVDVAKKALRPTRCVPGHTHVHFRLFLEVWPVEFRCSRRWLVLMASPKRPVFGAQLDNDVLPRSACMCHVLPSL